MAPIQLTQEVGTPCAGGCGDDVLRGRNGFELPGGTYCDLCGGELVLSILDDRTATEGNRLAAEAALLDMIRARRAAFDAVIAAALPSEEG
jgi:hypothetical protein